MKYTRILLIALVTILYSCGGDSDDGKTMNSNLAESMGINGTCLSNCYESPYDPGLYIIDSFSFSGNSVTTTFWDYQDSSCSGSVSLTGSASGSFVIGEEVTTDSGLKATEIDFNMTYQGSQFTILDIIQVSENYFYLGVWGDSNIRPTELKFDTVLTKQ